MSKSPVSPLNQIETRSLREQVLDTLRDAIIGGDLKPGQALRETDLSSQLGVSRAPLREALQILASEGLVEVVPYRGTAVRRLTKTDIEELYSLRSVLEAFAVRRIIGLGNPEDVKILRQCYDDMLAAAETGDLKQINLVDRAFHDTLIELSGHSLLQSSWNVVSMRVRQVMALLNRRNTDLKQIAYNHTPIIEAIEKGDEKNAVRLIEKHIAASGDLIVEGWDENGTGGIVNL